MLPVYSAKSQKTPYFLFLLTLASGLLLVGAVIYFSWIPDPALNGVSWLPRWLAGWADRFGNLRTAVPFILLGLLAGYRLCQTQYPPKTWWGIWGALLALITLVEVGQYFLPRRHCDWRDIAWGAGGAAAGLLPFWLRRERELARSAALQAAPEHR